MVKVINLDELSALRGVRHAFFTRVGGVSQGVFASLNCGYGSGDKREDVAENRTRALAQVGLPADALVTVHQRHTAIAVTAEAARAAAEPLVADALVTGSPDVALGVLAADCAPILFADAEAGVIGAAHAGWRGALAGVAEATVAAMVELGARADRIVAGVGPCIGQASYQVGPEFPAPFLAEDAGAADLFSAADGDGRRHFDLAGYVLRRLARLGLRSILAARLDTCADAERFFSYRRTRLHGGTDYGRLLSVIARVG